MLLHVNSQLQQSITLFILYAIGKMYANIYPSWSMTLLIILLASTIEQCFIYRKTGRLDHISYSVLSTTFGVLLMLASSMWWIYLVVMVLTILQKHMLTVDNMHFYNPSNFALIAAVAIFYNKSHIVTGQLGDAIWLNILVVILALIILLRVDRWVIPLVFVLSYLLLQYIMVAGYDPVIVFESIYERFYAVSFVLFVAFMLTDPHTTPVPKWQQGLFAVIIAAIATYLDRINGFRVQHLFMALFVSSVWIPSLRVKPTSRKQAIAMSSILFILAAGVIIFIESQPPYHFEMEG